MLQGRSVAGLQEADRHMQRKQREEEKWRFILRITSGLVWTQAVPVTEFWVSSTSQEGLEGVCPRPCIQPKCLLFRTAPLSSIIAPCYQNSYRSHPLTSDPATNARVLGHSFFLQSPWVLFPETRSVSLSLPVKLESWIQNCLWSNTKQNG